jgi:hypothetical protein
MTDHEASRTLVKSPPELWAECSDASSLGRHLSASFGEIRITRLEPETAVAWEGECASGTVRLEPSGWGTRVVLTASAAAAAVPEPTPPEPETPPEAMDPLEAMEVAEALEVAEPEDPPEALEVAEPEDPPEPAPDPMPAHVILEAPTRSGLFARLFGAFRAPKPRVAGPALRFEEPEAYLSDPEPVLEPEPDSLPSPETVAAQTARSSEADPTTRPREVDPTTAGLTAALDSLGQAHHRPFSRA